MTTEWISVKDKLPMEGIENGIIGEFLVTVELKNPNANDEAEVMILWFETGIKQFSQDPAGIPYDEENQSWMVTHWMPLPKPPYRFSLSKETT